MSVCIIELQSNTYVTAINMTTVLLNKVRFHSIINQKNRAFQQFLPGEVQLGQIPQQFMAHYLNTSTPGKAPGLSPLSVLEQFLLIQCNGIYKACSSKDSQKKQTIITPTKCERQDPGCPALRTEGYNKGHM